MATHAYLWWDEADQSYGRRLSAHLMQQGVRHWWDRRPTPVATGADQLVDRMMSTSGAFVAVVSRRSVTSARLRQLVELAARADRPVILLARERLVAPPELAEAQHEQVRRDAMPDLRLIEQLKDLTGYYLPKEDPEPEFTPAAPARRRRVLPVTRGTAPAKTVEAAPPARSKANRAVAIVVLVAVLACAAWQPAAAATAVGFVWSFFGGLVQFFRALGD